MTRRARNLIALALAVCGALIAATYRPFGGRESPIYLSIPNPAQSGYDTGIEAAGLAPDEVARFKTDQSMARFIASQKGVSPDIRDVWCANFVSGLHVGREFQARGRR